MISFFNELQEKQLSLHLLLHLQSCRLFKASDISPTLQKVWALTVSANKATQTGPRCTEGKAVPSPAPIQLPEPLWNNPGLCSPYLAGMIASRDLPREGGSLGFQCLAQRCISPLKLTSFTSQPTLIRQFCDFKESSSYLANYLIKLKTGIKRFFF